MSEKINVGGQAVIEGVMMRSPKAFTVAVRRADNTIAVREEEWKSLWDRFKFLRWPFLRGTIVLIEAMTNGMSALAFSANEAAREFDDTEKKSADENAESANDEKPSGDDDNVVIDPDSGTPLMSNLAIGLTMAFSFVLGIGLFVALPHFATWGIGHLSGYNLDVDSFWFHLIDGAIKICIFLAYLWAIRLMPDIKRVFMYHGAEHKSIFTHESGEELTVENARKHTRFHPRCGTAFLINVLIISILFFTLVFPFVPLVSENVIINQVANVGMKILMMFPIAGISYEFIKFAGSHLDNKLTSVLIKPGLWMQKLTTIEPTDDMLEIALISIKTAIYRQKSAESQTPPPNTPLRIIRSIDDLDY